MACPQFTTAMPGGANAVIAVYVFARSATFKSCFSGKQNLSMMFQVCGGVRDFLPNKCIQVPFLFRPTCRSR